MSKKIFTEQEMLELSKNKYVKNVTAKGITYTNEFKLQFIVEYEKIGKLQEEFKTRSIKENKDCIFKEIILKHLTIVDIRNALGL